MTALRLGADTIDIAAQHAAGRARQVRAVRTAVVRCRGLALARAARRWALAAALGGSALSVLAAGGASAAPSAGQGLFRTTLRWENVQPGGPNDYGAPTELRARSDSSPLGGLGAVTWSADPTGGQPAGCGAQSQPASVSGTLVAFTPNLACNGPYRIHLHASGGALGGADLDAPVAYAIPGAAMPAPGVQADASGQVRTAWAPAGYPDVAGYRVLLDGVGRTDVGADQSSATFPVGGGSHQVQLVVLRWGLGGPGHDVVASPPSDPTGVIVAGPPAGGGAPGAPGAGGASPGGGAGAGGGVGGPSALPPIAPAQAVAPVLGSHPTRSYRSGGVIAPGGPPTTADTGYQGTLPYGARSTGAASASHASGPARPGSTTQVVDRTRRTKPGLVVPAAVAMVLLAGALHLRWLMARSAHATAADPGLRVEA